MGPGLSAKSPYWRYVHLRKLLQTIKARAKDSEAPFSILCYGSASYGYNPDNHGKLDDLDLFIVLSPKTTTGEFLASIGKLPFDGIEVSKSHVDHLLSGKCEMCRLYCQLEGVRVGFRLISEGVLEKVSSDGSNHPLRNIASLGQSRIVTDQEWSFVLKGYVPTTYTSFEEIVGGQQVLTVLQSIFSDEGRRLGALGRKLLTASCIYAAPKQGLRLKLRRIWRMFVLQSLAAHPELSNDEIIGSITRAEKFSKNFRAKLSRTIDLSRIG